MGDLMLVLKIWFFAIFAIVVIGMILLMIAPGLAFVFAMFAIPIFIYLFPILAMGSFMFLIVRMWPKTV